MNIWAMVKMARAVATSRVDERGYLIGAIGTRRDGTIVTASNGSSPHKCPNAHAEMRLLRKLGKHAKNVIVVRVKKGSGRIGLAKPCPTCMRALLRSRVTLIMWSISEKQFGGEYGG